MMIVAAAEPSGEERKTHWDYLYDAEENRAERRYMVNKLLKLPCKICGSNEHKTITQQVEGDQSTIQYECPAALQENWNPFLHHSVYNRNIELCPSKFSEMYGFQKAVIMEKFNELKEYGFGGRISSVRWYVLKESILKICDEQNEACRRFKREVPNKEDEEDYDV